MAGDAVLIVAGSFTVAPADRDEFIARQTASMVRSRSEPGCLAYAFMADPLEPGVALLYECWESQAALDAHLEVVRAPRPTPPEPPIEVLEQSVLVYPVAPEGPRPL